MEITIENSGFRVNDSRYLIIINQIGKERWKYDFYKVPDDSTDSSKMEPACSPFESGVPWQQSRYKDSLFVNCMMHVFVEQKEKIQELVQEITTELYKISDEYIENQKIIENSINSETPKEEHIEPKVISEADKIISEKNSMKYILDFISVKYVGDIPFKKYSIYSLMSLGISNIDETLHTFSYGSTEIGKTEMSTRILEVLPDEFKIPYDDLSPKTLWYLKNKIHPNMLIVMNDKVISDNFAELLLKDCDKNGWNSGCTRAIPSGDGNGVIDMSIPPRILWWITSNKSIPEHQPKDAICDYNALKTRFYTYHRKDYTQKQVEEIKKHIATFRIPKDYEHRKEVVKQILRTLLSKPKYIDLNYNEEIEVLCVKSGLRQTQRIYSLLKCSALIRNSDIVEEEDISNIKQLLKDVETTEAELDRETPLLLKSLLPESIFMAIFNSTSNIHKDKLKFEDTYTRDGISKNSGISYNSLGIKLKSLKEMGIINNKLSSGSRNTYIYYKLKDETETTISDYVSNEIEALKIQKIDASLLPEGKTIKPSDRLMKPK